MESSGGVQGLRACLLFYSEIKELFWPSSLPLNDHLLWNKRTILTFIPSLKSIFAHTENLGLKSVVAIRTNTFSASCSKFLSAFRSTVRNVFGTIFGGHLGHESSIPTGSRMRAREDIEAPYGKQWIFNRNTQSFHRRQIFQHRSASLLH